MRIRVVVTDIDGTIAREGNSLTSATLAATRELAASGVPLIAATARIPSGLTFLEPEMPAFTVAVCCNGSLGVDLRHGRPPWPPPWDELWRHQLSAATVGKVVAALTALLPDAGIAAFDGSGWVLTASYLSARGRKPRAPSRLTDAAAFGRASAFALSVCHPELSANQVAAELRRAGITPADATLSHADPRLLDVSPAGVDKASGVARALDILGIPPEEAVAFGDAPNDIPLFKLAGRAVAVANAHPDLLAAADAVTESVADDGFSRELRRLGLIGQYHSS